MLHSATTSIVKILNWVSRQRPRIQLDTLAQISFRFLSFTTMALLLEDMDLNVNAGDDFYSFANGRGAIALALVRIYIALTWWCVCVSVST